MYNKALVGSDVFSGDCDVLLTDTPATIVYQDGPVALLNGMFGGGRCVGKSMKTLEDKESHGPPSKVYLPISSFYLS